MPRLPDIDALGRRPVPQGRRGFAQQDTAAPGLALAQVGQSISQIGAVVEQINRQDDIQGSLEDRRKLNEWERQKVTDPETGAIAKRGKDAFDLPKTLVEEFDKFASETRGAIKSPRRRQAFQQMVEARREQLSDWSSKHAGQERKVYIEGEYRANVKSFQERAAIYATDDAKIATEITFLKDITAEHFKGRSPEESSQQIKENIASLHTSVLRALIADGNTDRAKQYFETNKNALDEQTRFTLGKDITNQSDLVQSSVTAQEIWAQTGPKKLNDPVLLGKMESAAREKYAKDPAKAKSTVSAIREMAQAHNAEQTEVNASNVNAVMAEYGAGRAMSKIQMTEAYRALPPTKQVEIKKYVEEQAYSRLLRVNAAEARDEAAIRRMEREQQRATGAAYLIYSDPEVLAGMSEAQVRALLPTLGIERTAHLTERRRAFQSKDAVREAKMDQDEFDQLADQAKLAPFEPSKSENQKRELGYLKSAVEQRIDAEQRMQKRVLTRDEKRKLMQEEIDNKVMLDTWGVDSTKSAFALRPDEIEKAYVVIDGKEVKLTDIPAADRLQIIQARVARKLPVTEVDIARTWLQGKPRGASGSY